VLVGPLITAHSVLTSTPGCPHIVLNLLNLLNYVFPFQWLLSLKAKQFRKSSKCYKSYEWKPSGMFLTDVAVVNAISVNNTLCLYIVSTSPVESAPFFIPSTSFCSLLLVHLIICILPHHSHHLRSHHLSLCRPFTPDLKLSFYTYRFPHSLLIPSAVRSWILNLYWT